MLDQEMLNQLKSVYSSLEKEITLLLKDSPHEKQGELEEMLQAISQTSEKIIFQKEEQSSPVPQFQILVNGQESGVHFIGIPGGHEFTSLVLAILNADGKGKLPDPAILERVKNLKGNIHLDTYISLSCENCPEVVQALNIMALNNPNFSHTMIDGSFVQEDIDRLNIQGVPSVMDGENLVSSGKTGFAELLKKLEEHFGKAELSEEKKDLGKFDVAVIGAGPAGASAAIYSARKGLRTAIIAETIGGQLQETKGIENLISVPYTEGPALAAQLLNHMKEYDIEFIEHRKVKEIQENGIKKIQLDSGEFLETKSVILATGAKWRQLGVKGEKEYLGRGVAYCPHCDGPYYKGKDVAVVGGGNSGVEAAIDLAGIVKSVTVFEYNEELKADSVLVKKLESLENVTIIKNAKTTEVAGDGQKLNQIIWEDMKTKETLSRDLDGVFVQIGLMPNSQFLGELVEKNQYGEILIDDHCKTNVRGIYAAGDVTNVPFKQIIVAMGEGAKAALTAFEDLAFS